MTAFEAVAATLAAFYGSFGVPAYTEDSVPEDQKEPYITYTLVCPDWRSTALHQARIWTRSESNAQLADLTDKLLNAIGEGVTIDAVGARGVVTIDPGTPLAQMQPMDDSELKVAYINLVLGAIIAQKGA